MGDGIGKPEYDRYRTSDRYGRSSSDTYFPSGDYLGAYGGRPGLYPGYPTGYQPDAPYLAGGHSHYGSAEPSRLLTPERSRPMSATTPGSGFREPLPRDPLGGSRNFSRPRQASSYTGTGRSRLDTIIIWDWDDTLMCSTAINTGRLMGGTAQLEALLEELLTTSMSLGETMIVTNADDMWVFESTRRFAPRLMPLLLQLPIISARRKFEAAFPGDVFAWKREAFREILASRSFLNGLNLVVLGDSPAEIEAAQTCSYGLNIHPMQVKTVKFKEAPSCEEVCEQQRMLLQDLSAIVAEERDSNRNLAHRVYGGGFPYSPSYSSSPSVAVPMSSSFHNPYNLDRMAESSIYGSHHARLGGREAGSSSYGVSSSFDSLYPRYLSGSSPTMYVAT